MQVLPAPKGSQLWGAHKFAVKRQFGRVVQVLTFEPLREWGRGPSMRLDLQVLHPMPKAHNWGMTRRRQLGEVL